MNPVVGNELVVGIAIRRTATAAARFFGFGLRFIPGSHTHGTNVIQLGMIAVAVFLLLHSHHTADDRQPSPSCFRTSRTWQEP